MCVKQGGANLYAPLNKEILELNRLTSFSRFADCFEYLAGNNACSAVTIGSLSFSIASIKHQAQHHRNAGSFRDQRTRRPPSTNGSIFSSHKARSIKCNTAGAVDFTGCWSCCTVTYSSAPAFVPQA